MRAATLGTALLIGAVSATTTHALARSASPACGECIGDLCVGSSAGTDAWLVQQYGPGVKEDDDVEDFKNGKWITRRRCYFDERQKLSVNIRLVATSPHEDDFVFNVIEVSSGSRCEAGKPARPFPPLKLDKGIGIGSSEAEIVRACGTPSEVLQEAFSSKEAEARPRHRELLYDPGLVFELLHDHVTLVRFIGRFPTVSSAGVCNPATNAEVETLSGRKIVQVIATQTDFPNNPNGPSCQYDTGELRVVVSALRYEYPGLAKQYVTRELLKQREDVVRVTDESGLGERAFWLQQKDGGGYYVVIDRNLQITVSTSSQKLKAGKGYRQHLRTIARQALEKVQ